MKANKKFVNKKETGVSVVVGVILMVAITVAIACTVYIYVSQRLTEEKEDITGVLNNVIIYEDSCIIQLDNKFYEFKTSNDDNINSRLLIFANHNVTIIYYVYKDYNYIENVKLNE